MCNACNMIAQVIGIAILPVMSNGWSEWNGTTELHQTWTHPTSGEVYHCSLDPAPRGVETEWSIYGRTDSGEVFWITDFKGNMRNDALMLAKQLERLYALVARKSASEALTPAGYLNENDLKKAQAGGRTVLGSSISPVPTNYHKIAIYTKEA